MQVTVNGKAREVMEGCTVGQLLHDLELSQERLAVEYNSLILHSSEYAKVLLKMGDTLEIVRFVGGG